MVSIFSTRKNTSVNGRNSNNPHLTLKKSINAQLGVKKIGSRKYSILGEKYEKVTILNTVKPDR